VISSKASDPADGGENRGPRRPLRPLSTEVTASVADRLISATDALRAGYLRVTCCRVHGDVAARLVAEPSRWPIPIWAGLIAVSGGPCWGFDVNQPQASVHGDGNCIVGVVKGP